MIKNSEEALRVRALKLPQKTLTVHPRIELNRKKPSGYTDNEHTVKEPNSISKQTLFYIIYCHFGSSSETTRVS